MGRQIADDDGTLYERDRDGEMVPVGRVAPRPLRPGALCEDHGEPYGYKAASCPDCISEALAGDRPRAYIGRHFALDE